MVVVEGITNTMDEGPSWEDERSSAQLVTFLIFYGIWRFIIAFTRACPLY
jgi:prolipoprotein diacylglyceryltransferase